MEVASFPAFDLNSNEPLQHQIHQQFVSLIAQGRLTSGLRLPSTRKLSEILQVSRNTIVLVIEQLKMEGFVYSQTGRGTFISNDIPDVISISNTQKQASKTTKPEKRSQFMALSQLGETMKKLSVSSALTLPFTPGVPDLKHFPHKIWHKLVRQHQDRTVLMGYDDPQGYLPLREALVSYLSLSRGVNCKAENILITQGSQQAISLCSQILLNEGDMLLHENPGYQGANRAFSTSKPFVQPVPLKNNSIDVDWMINHCEKLSESKIIYTTPAHQYPMGGLLPASDRLRLINWATENNKWILEDDYDSEYHFNHKPIAAMQGMTKHNNVIYMGSFSKTLFPALRLGYLILPDELIRPFTVAKSYLTGDLPLLNQAVVADFIMQGHFVRHLRKMRKQYKEKFLHFEQLINTVLKTKVNIIAESAGMHLVIEIPNINDVQLKNKLYEHGFGSSALSSYYLNDEIKTGLVLGFANTTEENRMDLVELLDKIL
ncbi:PLP-dependent aminotransferase family protein [Marinicellulosiphila megalodicopiae]|uniref:MocR-like pyridoxine biosynthesis transcription factor PdxR n=1 Tax=Marinicellulosiphila megalodicopiae TaxID=2724896 RepID=UPI003BAE33C0